MRIFKKPSYAPALSGGFQSIALLLLSLTISSKCYAGSVSAVSAIGIGLKFNQNEVKIYSEVSYWPDYLLGIGGFDAGIEIGNKAMDIYTEAQLGFMGLGGYSHGVYYRNPYISKNHFGFRGKAWSGAFVYMAFDLDYTDDVHMFGFFAKKPYEYENGEWRPLSLAW